MTDAVIKAVYHDYKRVPSRKAFQIICEVPIEQAPLVHRMFGEPDPSESLWVAIAKMDPGEIAPETPAEPQKTNPSDLGESKRSWDELKPSQQAGIRCNEPAFDVFLKEQYFQNKDVVGKGTAELLREFCDVQSRSELNTNQHAAHLWRMVCDDFQVWQAAPQHGIDG